MKLAKAHLARLKSMLKSLEKAEEFHRKQGHELYPRSRRASDIKDADTLRAVIAYLESPAGDTQ